MSDIATEICEEDIDNFIKHLEEFQSREPVLIVPSCAIEDCDNAPPSSRATAYTMKDYLVSKGHYGVYTVIGCCYNEQFIHLKPPTETADES